VFDGVARRAAFPGDGHSGPLRVILLSARAGEEARIEGLHAGANDYLVKPFSAKELLARVQSQIELSKLRREIKESHDRLLAFFEQAPVGFCTLEGPRHVYSFVNPVY